MKLKDFLGKVVKNKRNGQLTTTFKKNQMKKSGVSIDELMDIDLRKFKLKDF
jgi:hypothetical protein